MSSRPGIYAARHVYAGIGGAIEKNGYDTISYRARTYKTQKLGWLGLSLMRSGLSVVTPKSPVLYAEPLDEVRFLVDAAAHRVPVRRSNALTEVLTQLEAANHARRAALLEGRGA